ncbi:MULTISPECIES: hypothetical protein [Lysobacter]|uniref:hypothetical protein n=1 Tax=Lysobacter TaxID=68 RepID=UPI001F2FF1A9|nr:MULTISPECIES: hypothetical protein [Lysobacter]UJB19234.1 hypothetical protein L1A79_23465 [Lysobacter capsici]UJQ27041.1 hypothetical protein L2D09_16420 [Lysobacter gummosus]
MEAIKDLLQNQVKRSTLFAVALIVLVVAVYLIWFGVFNPGGMSPDPAVWGQFGDYVGGILNPLIAFLAFYWLTKSVLLQRQELQETKDALKSSAESQARQEAHSQRSVRVSALSAILVSHNSDVAAIRSEIQRINDAFQGGVALDEQGERIAPRDIPLTIKRLNGELLQHLAARDQIAVQIDAELHELANT